MLFPYFVLFDRKRIQKKSESGTPFQSNCDSGSDGRPERKMKMQKPALKFALGSDKEKAVLRHNKGGNWVSVKAI